MARVTKHAVRLNHLLLAAPRRRITSRHTVRRPLTHLPAATCAALVRHNPLSMIPRLWPSLGSPTRHAIIGDFPPGSTGARLSLSAPL